MKSCFSTGLALTLGLGVTLTNAETIECRVSRKLDSKLEYTPEKLAKDQYSVRITRTPKTTILERCSYSPTADRVTCDPYEADIVREDPNVRITKYYVTKSHFDVQLFSDGFFIENNGRGTIAFGQCR